MTRNALTNRLSTVAIVALALWAGGASADDASTDKAIEPAFSRPSEERRLAFYGPGVVSDLMVKEGDAVKEGQVLSKQDDSGEQVAMRKAQEDADNLAEINYEKVDKADKEVKLERKQSLFDNGRAASISELEEAKLAVKLAEAQILVAEQKHSDAVSDAQSQKIKVEHMQLKSTIDGLVQTVNIHPGEMADPQNKEGAIVVVKNDPLHVVVHPAAEKALKLQMGQELQVRYAAAFGSDPFPWQSAKIIYFAPKADAGSKTEEIWLELPNPTGQKSGLAMEVRLPASVVPMAAGAPAMGTSTLPPLANP